MHQNEGSLRRWRAGTVRLILTQDPGNCARRGKQYGEYCFVHFTATTGSSTERIDRSFELIDTLPSTSIPGTIEEVYAFPAGPEACIVLITGWMLHPASGFRHVIFEIEHQAPLIHEDIKRNDIAEKFPRLPHAADSGFILGHYLPRFPSTPLRLDIRGLLDTGAGISESLFVAPTAYPATFNTAEPEKTPTPYGSIGARSIMLERLRLEYDLFLKSGAVLSFPRNKQPETSVIIVNFNKAFLTWACLRALKTNSTHPLEVIIVDNASTDSSSQLFTRVQGIQLIQNPSNSHFLVATNIGAMHATGKNLLFLNNDTMIFPGAVEHSIRTLETTENAGAVGARLIRPDGLLQEAGSVINVDGSTCGIGSGAAPWSIDMLKVEPVDYCSAAFLLTPRELFSGLGAFDLRYFPAYYEDADYCVRLRKSGKVVMCDPGAAALHIGSASSDDFSSASSLMLRNRKIFLEQHPDLFNVEC